MWWWGINILVWNGHHFKGMALTPSRIFSGALRAEITPNFYFMKRFPCEEGGGTTIIFHTLRGQGTITLTSPIKKQKQNKKNLAAHFFWTALLGKTPGTATQAGYG